MSNMPIHPVDMMVAGMSDYEARIIRAAYTTRGVPAGGRLRANKPFRNPKNEFEGCANYAWRMLCFDLAGFGKHTCMPVTADFEVMIGFDNEHGRVPLADRANYDERRRAVRDAMKTIDELVKRAESVLPIESKKGLLRWGRALGAL